MIKYTVVNRLLMHLRGADVDAEEVDADLGEDVADEGITDGGNVTFLVRINPKHVRGTESEGTRGIGGMMRVEEVDT